MTQLQEVSVAGRSLHVQGHRGARGLKPENTLPSFEAALDSGVQSIETDVQLTRDGVPVLSHDPHISERLCRLIPGSRSPPPSQQPLVRHLTLTQLRGYRADRNPDPLRFPDEDNSVTPLAEIFAHGHELDPYTPPALTDLFAFALAYAGASGAQAGKSQEQRARAARVIFDIELKQVSGQPEQYLLERQVVDVIRAGRAVERSVVRSFDDRSVRRLLEEEPRLTGAVLMIGTAPVDPVQIVRAAGARIYCPDFQSLDAGLVRLCHAEGIEVIPWTVNQPADWQRLVDAGVDGITTDYPDRLLQWLRG